MQTFLDEQNWKRLESGPTAHFNYYYTEYLNGPRHHRDVCHLPMVGAEKRKTHTNTMCVFQRSLQEFSKGTNAICLPYRWSGQKQRKTRCAFSGGRYKNIEKARTRCVPAFNGRGSNKEKRTPTRCAFFSSRCRTDG